MNRFVHVRSFLILVVVDVDTYIENQRQDQDDIDSVLRCDRDPVNRA